MIKIKEVTKVPDREYASGKGRAKKVRIYYSVEGENILQNLVLRQSRPNKLYRKFLPEVLKEMGFPEGTKAYWDQHAGCSCPCSPGFVVSSWWDSGHVIYVTLEGETQADKVEAMVDVSKAVVGTDRLIQVLSDPTLPFKQGGVVAEAEERRLAGGLV